MNLDFREVINFLEKRSKGRLKDPSLKRSLWNLAKNAGVRVGNKSAPLLGHVGGLAAEAWKFGSGVAYKAEAFDSPLGLLLIAGGRMEDELELLKAVNEEVETSKKILEDLVNQIRGLADIVLPATHEHIKKLRESRMSTVNEIHMSLSALKDLRQFFLDDNYDLEVERMERFVALCKEVQLIKESGLLDAVSDTMIRLSLKEESKENER